MKHFEIDFTSTFTIRLANHCRVVEKQKPEAESFAILDFWE